jgi:spermidine/putrescine transport system ATP-binding protein
MGQDRKKTIIRIENVSKAFGNVVAVDNVSLDIEEGEFFALLGPSGCGKTTLLRMIAGFELPGEGRILIDGMDVSHVPPNKRPVNMVFQSYAVFPHMTVFDNVAYGLRVSGVGGEETHRRVIETLALVQLENYGRRKPDQLSGGQRQRVALARALVKRPRVLLLDEPLSALDAKLREQMRGELAQLQEKIGITFVIVTHDQDEALALAGRCAVMHKGALQQVASPTDLYEYPNSRFVADFIGQVNLIEGRLAVDERDHAVIEAPKLAAPIYLDHGVTGAQGATVWVAIRPEKMRLAKRAPEAPPPPGDAPAGHNVVAGTICHIAYLGSVTMFEVQTQAGAKLRVLHMNPTRSAADAFTADEPVWISWPAGAPAVLLS